jgi:hypothetical protein
MSVPRELLQIVDSARPQCSFWLKGWCKKGASCKQRHGKPDDQVNAQLPHISRHDGADGTRITLRPPLQPAIKEFFRSSGKPCTLGRSKVPSNRSDLLAFELVHMRPPNVRACTDVQTKGYVEVWKRSGPDWAIGEMRKPGPCGQAFPQVLCHGTKLTNLCDILRDGALKPSEGIAGVGVYGFKVDVGSDGQISDADMLKAYERTRVGYNGGAAFFLRCTPGILIKGSTADVLAEGTIAVNGDQFSAHPSVLSYELVIVSLNGWVATLQEFLDASGYTAALHSALSDVANYVNGTTSSSASDSDLIQLTNSAVADGRHHQTKFGKKKPDDDMPDEGIDRSSEAE